MTPSIPTLPMSGSQLKATLDDFRDAIVICHDSLDDMIADTALVDGDVVNTPAGQFMIVAPATLTANGSTVIELTGTSRQAVLAPREPLPDAASIRADTRNSAYLPEGVKLATHSGQSYRVAASTETDPHLFNAGGAGLYLVDRESDLEAMGAVSQADPTGRHLSAPALVSTMESRRLGGVTLRDLLGRNYSPTNDAAATLSGFLAELAPAGIAIRDPDNMGVLCTEPIRPQSGMKLLLGPETTLVRGFSAPSSDTTGLISRADWGVNTDDALIEGGHLTTASPAQIGRMISLYGDRWTIRNTRITEYYGSQGMVFGGDDVRLENVVATTSDASYGTGAFRMVGGRGFRGIGLHGESGDDVFQFVPITGSTNARYNQSISDSYYIGCHGHSRSARLLVAVVAGPQNEDAMTCTLRNLGWIGCSGSGGNRVLNIENTEGTGAVDRQIDNVVISQCSLDGSQQDASTSQDVMVLGDFAGAIGSVSFRDVTVHGTSRSDGMTLQSESAEILLDNCSVSGVTTAVSISAPMRVTIRDGRYTSTADGGGAAGGHVIDVRAVAAATQLVLEGQPRITGIASNRSAIRLSASSAELIAGQFTAEKAVGATDTTGISHAPGARAAINEILGTIDSTATGGGTVRLVYRTGVGAWLEIVAGQATLTHAEHRLDSEGLVGSDTLETVVFPDWAGDGQLFTLRPRNGSRPITLSNGSGNIRCHGDRVLAGPDAVFIGMKTGNSLIEVSFHS